jgi:hypothetical protein
MSDAVQIRRYSGALRTKHSCSPPSLIQPPPARRPNPKISNRESLRLEISVTQTKQTTAHLSNREKEACFSDRVRADDSARQNIDRPARHPKPEISNRESLRLEIDVTQTKQTTAYLSNREKEACFSNHHQAPVLKPAECVLRRQETPGDLKIPSETLSATNPQEKTIKTAFSSPPKVL